MKEILAQSSHRPWPLPAGPWIMEQRWHDLAFLHWPVDPTQLRPLLPAALELDLFDGQAWVGVVPFRMSHVRPRLVPALPWLSAFPELNVRTYVKREGKAGVYFFSLEASNPVAVRAARATYRLPYFDAAMELREEAGWIHYRSRRTHRGAPPAEFVGRYRPAGEPFLAAEGSIDRWLTERYCLYVAGRRGAIYRGEIHHQPWPLQPCEAEIETNTMGAASGIKLEGHPPVRHFARFLKVAIWPLLRVPLDGKPSISQDNPSPPS